MNIDCFVKQCTVGVQSNCGDLEIEDLDQCSDSISSADSPTKVYVDDVPPPKRDATLIKYYLSSLMSRDCEVQQYGKTFLATFQQQIGTLDYFQLVMISCVS